MLLSIVGFGLSICGHGGSTAFDPLRVRVPGGVPYLPLRWGSVEPEGWVRDWAVAASRGAVSPKNAWFAGGNGSNGRVNGWKDGQPHFAMDEQAAYWIDGMIRLGLVLHDEELQARVSEDIDSVIQHGYFNTNDGGPEGWPRAVYSRAMLAYFDSTGDKRILPFFAKYWNSTYHMDSSTPAARSLAQAEAMIEGYAYGGEDTLLETALRGLTEHQSTFQAAWNSVRCEDYSKNTTCVQASYELEHGVTWNEIAKVWALAGPWAQQKEAWLNASIGAYELMHTRDMLPYGVNSAEEALSGIAPNASTETCDVSDFIHSNTWLLRHIGHRRYGDRLEKAFFNAAPGALNRNYSQHVYYQSPNLQRIPPDYIECGAHCHLPALALYGHNISERWAMNIFHTPPCCTGNQARLLPNWIHHQWLQSIDGGLVAALYSPNRVTTTLPGGQKVRVVVNTDYPFKEAIEMTVSLMSAAHAADPSAHVMFPLHLRIPEWCASPSLTVNGETVGPIHMNEYGFFVLSRTWTTGDKLILKLPMNARLETDVTVNNGGLGNAFNSNRNNWVRGGLPYSTVSLGPLLFALPLEKGEPWEFALHQKSALKVQRAEMPAVWDWPYTPPVSIVAEASPIEWPDVWALPATPFSKVSEKYDAVGPNQLTLVPYGCTKPFKVSMFPYVTGDTLYES